MQPRNLLTEWARLLLESLVQAGVETAVISPGSRSTPFTVAALRSAGLSCHSVVDERSAAFFALGQAKVSGRPALLICTSGTAGAHYLPAVVEAAYSRVPLLVLTADRPFELLECAAPQTIDQTHLFGCHVRWFADLGAPQPEALALAALRRKASQAVLATQHPAPGPVHLNAHASKPLEPVDLGALQEPTEGESTLREKVDELLAEPVPRARPPELEPSPSALSLLLERLTGCRRGLLVVGRRELSEHLRSPFPEAPLRLAEAADLPLLVESPSQLRLRPPSGAAHVIDAVDSVLRVAWPEAEGGTCTPRASSELLLPDFVLELGPPLTSSAWATFAQRLPRGVRYAVGNVAWSDPQNNLAELILADPWQVAEMLAGRIPGRAPRSHPVPLAPFDEARSAWTGALEQVNLSCWQAIDRTLECLAGDPSALLSEPLAVRALVSALPPRALLALGNSLAIREVDWVCPRGSANVDVWVQRGVNGIDGLIAGASGAAHASGRPTCLLLGDVSALHDLGSLSVARTVSVPFLVAVIDNGGGRIFDLLPLAASTADDSQARFWSTPPALDWQAAAQTFGLAYQCCRTAPEIQRSVQEAFSSHALPRATLLHLRVDGSSVQRFLHELREPSRRS